MCSGQFPKHLSRGLTSMTISRHPGWLPECRSLPLGHRCSPAQSESKAPGLPAAFPLVRTLQSYHGPRTEPCALPFTRLSFPGGPRWVGGDVACPELPVEEKGARLGLTSQLLRDSSGDPCLPAPLIAARAQLAQLPLRP